jgi:LacI family transcriptional regulator
MGKHVNATLKSIAEKVHVSAPTVSRVLSGKAREFRISKETAAAIKAAARELGYTPNYLASGLRLRKTHTLGLVIPDISNPFFASVAREIEKTARSYSYSIILCDSEENTKQEAEAAALLQGRKVDGMLVCPVGQEAHHLRQIRDRHLPLVLIDRFLPDISCPFVGSDNRRGAFEAMMHLQEKGHRSIACVQGLRNTSTNRERVGGYCDALKAQGVPIDESLIVGSSFGEENGYIETKLLLSRTERPTAIFALGNLIALGALRALAESNLHVPEDISLISFDDQRYFSFLATPVTTIAQQNEEIGRIAVKLLIDEIRSPGVHTAEGIFLPPRLIIRSSVARIDPPLHPVIRALSV